MQKVWDCFSFFCEKELLELRLKHMWEYVDYFVITEADMTHQAEKKDFLLPRLLEDELFWAKGKIKLILLEVDLENLPETRYQNSQNAALGEMVNSVTWKIENLQRNAAMKEVNPADENDIILVGDLDEIPNERVLSNLRIIAESREILTVGMVNCPYYLNIRLEAAGKESPWAGTVIGKRKHLILPQMWRDVREIIHWVPTSGYHFSWLVKYFESKIKSTAHDEVIKLFEKSSLFEKAKNLQDMYDRQDHKYIITDIEADSNFPLVFKQMKQEFPELYYISSYNQAQL